MPKAKKFYEAKGEQEKLREMRNASRKRNYAQTAKDEMPGYERLGYERPSCTQKEDERVLTQDITDPAIVK